MNLYILLVVGRWLQHVVVAARPATGGGCQGAGDCDFCVALSILSFMGSFLLSCSVAAVSTFNPQD